MCVLSLSMYVSLNALVRVCVPLFTLRCVFVCLWYEVSTVLDSAWTYTPRPCSEPQSPYLVLIN